MYAQGYHGDTSRMFTVGQVSDKAQQLCAVTLEALEAAVALCGPGVPVRKIGEVTIFCRVPHVTCMSILLCSPNCWHTLPICCSFTWLATAL